MTDDELIAAMAEKIVEKTDGDVWDMSRRLLHALWKMGMVPDPDTKTTEAIQAALYRTQAALYRTKGVTA